jgi:hypothetical protein
VGMRKVSRLFPVFLLVLVLVPTHSLQSSGAIRYVNNTALTCQGHSPCYPTIQAAVNAAQRGDTISIQAGTYSEQITITGKNNVAGASEAGRIRLEAFQQNFTGNTNPTRILASPFALFLPTTSAPSVRVVHIDG